MSLVSALYVGLFYFATVFLVVGLALRIKTYAQTPAPLKIPTMPAPRTETGVVFRLFREVAFFESLFRSNKWIWLFGIMFHFGMLLVLLRHLRYFTEPVWFWVNWVQPFGKYAAFAMLAGLLGLWARRFLVARVRYITTPSDHLMLALMVGIALSGIGMTFLVHTDIVQLKAFALGLLYLSPQPLPGDPLLLTHLGLVIILMIIFPISKLLHAPGIFFSPTRNQTDSSREQRHIADWAKELEAGER
ncbi:Sulfite reduction-associated complex DsrMKJOP protein DsrM (= HmeC) [hydrothermal vent metagenome]|uniref:Sulfite reduction-associated complex DsrMKJOP protein DsrM (= HmeC) n=1 Tax=hydrothermal vent metagenome TaxID=652676 RepID=A0A3B0ZPP6_9ZZZZ